MDNNQWTVERALSARRADLLQTAGGDYEVLSIALNLTSVDQTRDYWLVDLEGYRSKLCNVQYGRKGNYLLEGMDCKHDLALRPQITPKPLFLDRYTQPNQAESKSTEFEEHLERASDSNAHSEGRRVNHGERRA